MHLCTNKLNTFFSISQKMKPNHWDAVLLLSNWKSKANLRRILSFESASAQGIGLFHSHAQTNTHTHANILCSKTSMTPLYVCADRYISSWSIHIFIESTETHWNFNVNDVNNVAVPPSIYSSDMPRFRLDWKIATQAVWAAVCVCRCVCLCDLYA